MGKRKVLKIANSEFLLAINFDNIETTGHIKNAIDITGLDFEMLSYLMSNLHNKGYQVKVLEI